MEIVNWIPHSVILFIFKFCVFGVSENSRTFIFSHNFMILIE